MLERDYDIASPWLRMVVAVPLAMLLLMFACGTPAEAQNYCLSGGVARTNITDPGDEAGFLMDSGCPNTTAYGRIEWATVLALVGPVLPSGAAFPGTPDTGDVFIVTDDSAEGACDSAAGSALTLCRWNGAAWVAVGDGGGGGGLASVAPADMDDDDFGDFSCATGVCTLDADTVAAAEMADADHGDVAWSAGVATVQAVTTDAIDAITEIAAAIKTGVDAKLATGTAGATDDCAKWNADGDLVSAGGACGVASGDITDVFDCSSGNCDSITVGATDLLDFSANDASTTTEGLILPQHATACAGGTAEGQVCWQASDNKLFVGNGATLTEVGAGGGGGEYHPDNYPPAGNIHAAQTDEFTGGASATWTTFNLDGATVTYALDAVTIRGGTTDELHGQYVTAPSAAADWSFWAKVTVRVLAAATQGCGVLVVHEGTAASPTELYGVYLRSTSTTAIGWEVFDADSYDLTGYTGIAAPSLPSGSDYATRTRSFYVGIMFTAATDTLDGLISWDGLSFFGLSPVTALADPLALAIFARDDADCTFEFFRTLNSSGRATGTVLHEIGS